jgi:ATP-dependent Lon protease
MTLIPVFPLSMVVFPGEVLKLHIFEPRYKQLISDCNDKKLSFGIPPYIEGKSLKYGTELSEIEIVKTYPDGKLDIKAKAISWFEIITFYRIMPGKLYPGAEIVRRSWTNLGDILYSKNLVELITELYVLMKIDNVVIPPPDWIKTYMLAHKLGLNIDQELELLVIEDEVDRQLYLINHLENLIPILKEAENLRKKAELNGHFQNMIPPNF